MSYTNLSTTNPVLSVLTTPPAHNLGDRYIIGETPSGDWYDHEGEIAESTGEDWLFYEPRVGAVIYVESDASTFLYTGTEWDEAGDDGPEGPVGPEGPQGDAGSVGPEGPEGPVGPEGPQGDAGSVGPEGPVGPVGPEGPQGLTGDAGPEGPEGSAGLGINSMGSVDTVASLNIIAGGLGPDDQGDAYLLETDDSLQIWNGSVFVSGGSIQGPAGPEGPQGDAGVAGPEGPVGPEGPQGDAGVAGPEGPEGPVGPEGPQGDAGVSGLANWTEDLNGNIIPNDNAQYDLGNAESKVRHLFLSSNSVWFGDYNKVDVSADGHKNSRKRKKASVSHSLNMHRQSISAGELASSGLADLNGDDVGVEDEALIHAGRVIDQAAADALTVAERVDELSAMTLSDWVGYAQTLPGMETATVSDIFDTAEDRDWEEVLPDGHAHSVVLISPSGSHWELSVNDLGELITAEVMPPPE